MRDILLGDDYEEDYTYSMSFYGDDYEPAFSDIPEEDWELCENCHNYRPCGKCALDFHDVEPDAGCTYNLKKKKED